MLDHKFRLVEYIATIGIEENSFENIKKTNGDLSPLAKVQLEGCVLSRFPLEDHPDFPFSSGIVNFCLPNGWYIETQPKRPLFYSVVLTDVDGVYSYAAYIVWNQFIQKCDNDGIATDIYAPKCICVVSKLPYFDIFKECLMTIFDGLWERNELKNSNDKYLAEKVVSALISSPQIFEPGVEPYPLSLYDKFFVNVQPPLTTQFNTTGDDVFFLAKHLGAHNLIRLYNVLLLDNKILFVSSSYNFLFKACNGLVSLLYPLKFNYVYIPLLPKSLTDIVNAPTPFMIGMHASSFISFCAGSLGNDVVVVNLDVGSVKINSDHHVPCFSDTLTSFLEVGLSNILFPELNTPDELFCKPKQMSDEENDKKIRAYFLILLVQIFEGYLSCTNVVRVHPKILIKFQKDQFLFRRDLCDCPFTTKFLDTMIFNQFISERGVPYRKCDIFDDLMMRYNNEVAEKKELVCLTTFINTAWSTFMENERVDDECRRQRSFLPEIGLFDEINFTTINIRDIEADKVKFTSNKPNPASLAYSSKSLAKMARSPSFVPLDINSYRFGLTFSISSIDSKIIKEFVKYIFEGETPRALQMIKKVQSLGCKPGIRVLLCNELNLKVKQNYYLLECEQFRILSDVINSYLNNENNDYCFTMSSLMVEMANIFFKKSKDNMVYIFTQLHNHRAWGFLPFWESLFYVSAQTQLNNLYLNDKTLASMQPTFDKEKYATYFLNERVDKCDDEQTIQPNETAEETVFHPSYHDVSRTTPVIVDQLINAESLGGEQLEIVEKLEDDILFSTISLFISQILYMNMQMKEASKYLRSIQTTNKLDNSDRAPAASGLSPASDYSYKSLNRSDTVPRNGSALTSYTSICELIQRFIANVFVTLDFKFESSSQINARMLEIMKFHCEALDRIYNEKETHLKDITEIVKAPLKIPGEIVSTMFACVLFPEGSVNLINLPSCNSPAILPAVGIVFATQYRLYFFGYPINRYTANCVVTRSIPFGQIRSSKAAESGYFPGIYQRIVTVSQMILIQLKTGGRVIFGLLPENGAEKNDLFSKILSKRYSRLLAKLSQSEMVATAEGIAESTGAAAGAIDTSDKTDSFQMSLSSHMIPSRKDSVVSTVDFDTISVLEGEMLSKKGSKVNLFKNSMKMKFKGLKQTATKKLKAAANFETGVGSLTSKSKLKGKQKVLTADFKMFYEQLFGVDTAATEESVTNKMAERSLYLADYGQRMRLLIFNVTLSSNLFSKTDWRLTLMNANKTIPTLPTVFPVCFQITDEIILRLSKLFKSKRVPVLTWTRAVPAPSAANASPNRFAYYPGALLRCGSVLKSLNVFSLKAANLATNTKAASGSVLSELDNYFITIAGISSKVKVMQTHKPNKTPVDSNDTSGSDEMYLDLLDRLRRPHMLFLTDTQEAYDVNDVSCFFSDLYIFGDKSFNKGVSDDKKLTVFNVDMPDASQLESAFLKLTKSLSPNKPEDVTQSSYMSLISKSRWFIYIKKVIELSANMAFSIDYGEAFSIAGFGDGSETSAQVSSLVQILLDPYYRTIDGFQTLVEKEWLAFKYNFVLRNGITNTSQSVFYPIFLQFLDCVHQLLIQFPSAFEFNDYFLKFLAYHHLSNKFSTFLTCSTDSFTTEAQDDASDISADLFSAKSSVEQLPINNTLKSLDQTDGNITITEEPPIETSEPVEAVVKEEETETNVVNDNEGDYEISTNVTPSIVTGRSSACSFSGDDEFFQKETIWGYINRYREKLPIFYNTEYVQGMYSVLYPSYHLASIDLWEYYYEVPELLTPSNYELEYIDTNLFIDSNAVFPYERSCSKNVTTLDDKLSDNGEALSFSSDENKDAPVKNFTFYSGASYLGYVINSSLVVDRFNHTINTYLNAYPEGAKLNSIINFANIYASDKLPRMVNVGTSEERKIFELMYCNYFSIICVKRFFISLVSKDKSFYSKTTLADSDHYFTQVTHDFVEAPPSEHLPYYTCQKCNLNIHIKCSKQISQVCSMGSGRLTSVTNLDTSDSPSKNKSRAKKYQTLFRNKDRNANNSLSIEADHKERSEVCRRSYMSKPSIDSFHRWSAISSTSESGQLTYSSSGSSNLYQGYLYSGKEQSASNKQYYVIDTKDQKLMVYDKKPSLPNSVLLDEYEFSDIERCVVVEADSYQNQTEYGDINQDRPPSYLGADSLRLGSIYLEIKFNFSEQPLLLRDKTDDSTRSWHISLSKQIHN